MPEPTITITREQATVILGCMEVVEHKTAREEGVFEELREAVIASPGRASGACGAPGNTRRVGAPAHAPASPTTP